MLTQLAKYAALSQKLRTGALEKKAVIGVLGTLVGKAATTVAKHPVAALTAATAVPMAKGKYDENVSKFRQASGQVPYPPGVG